MDDVKKLISKFETGDKPTGKDFEDLINNCYSHIKEVDGENLILEDGIIKIKDESISPEKTNFFKKKVCIDVDFSQSFDIANSSGEVVPGNNYITYDLIPVESNFTYFFSRLGKIAFFKSDGTFKDLSIVWSYNELITISEDVRYIRFSSDDITKYVFAKSDVPLTFEEANDEGIKDEYINLVSAEKVIGLSEKIKNVFDVKKEIACYGDSLTEGAGTSNGAIFSYPAALQNLINSKNVGFDVANRGIGGEDTKKILIRQGSYGDFVEPFIIPSNTDPVKIQKSTSAGQNGTKNGVNPVSIKGIIGNLIFSDGDFYFARINAGETIEIDRPTPIIRSSNKEDKDKIQILFMGQNGGFENTEELIIQYKRAIEFLGHNKFLVIGLTTGNEAERKEMEEKMEIYFGVNYINMREYLNKYGLSDNGLQANSNDESYLEQGMVPSQLLSDGVHLNNEGYLSFAKAVYDRGQELEFWD